MYWLQLSINYAFINNDNMRLKYTLDGNFLFHLLLFWRLECRVKYNVALSMLVCIEPYGQIGNTILCLSPLLRHESKRSWRSCCCWSSRAMSSGGWSCYRRSRGSYRPRGRTSRLCWMTWWDTHMLHVHVFTEQLVLWKAKNTHVMTDVPCLTHIHTHVPSLRVHGCEIIKSLLPVIVLWAALFSFCASKASWLHCVELQALEVIVPAERASEGPSQIAG